MVRDILTAAVFKAAHVARLGVNSDVLSVALMFEMQGSTLYHCNHGENFAVMSRNEGFTDKILLPCSDRISAADALIRS